jgi:signal transduction histidine kinase
MTVKVMRVKSEVSESEDREIDLHDSTIQTLYAMGLRLEYCMDIVEGAPGQVKDVLQDVLHHLDDVITELRRRIYELD